MDKINDELDARIKSIYANHLYEPGHWGPDKDEKYPTMKAYILGKIAMQD
jgi:hypothetical protein